MALITEVVVTLDCAEAEPLAQFWSLLLHGEVSFRSDAAIGIRAPGISLAFLVVPNYRPPTWPADDVPAQIHLDLGVDDLEAALAEALELGARQAEHQPRPDHRRVLFDPAGHPFCLTTKIPKGPAGGS